MKRKGRDSRINLALTVVLVFFVCFLSFSVGVLSGKGWSDREYALKTIEENTQFANKALEGENDVSPLSADMTEKEVELLAKKALEEARKDTGPEINEADEIVAELEQMDKLEKAAKGLPTEEGDKDKTVAAPDKETDKRETASVPQQKTKTTVPKPKSIEWTVQVAAYYTPGEAEEHSQKLIEKGFPAFPVKADINGKQVYRVVIGSFKTKREAKKYRQDLKKQAVVKTSFIQKIMRK